jgi:hypothetical protein
MNWNHRIVRTPAGDLSFKEVHYNDDGAPAGYTDIFTFGETVADLATLAYRLRMACKEPVLTPADFVEADEEAITGMMEG